MNNEARYRLSGQGFYSAPPTWRVSRNDDSTTIEFNARIIIPVAIALGLVDIAIIAMIFTIDIPLWPALGAGAFVICALGIMSALVWIENRRPPYLQFDHHARVVTLPRRQVEIPLQRIAGLQYISGYHGLGSRHYKRIAECRLLVTSNGDGQIEPVFIIGSSVVRKVEDLTHILAKVLDTSAEWIELNWHDRQR